MKRLTSRDEYGNNDIIGVDGQDLQSHLEFDEFNLVTEALNRLAAYEETGLDPNEITYHTIQLKEWQKKCGLMHTDNSQLRIERDQYKKWVNDLQSGMYVNCVYCGHRYGLESEVPASMADVLKEHIEKCPKHPMSLLKTELNRVNQELSAALEHLSGHCEYCAFRNDCAKHDNNDSDAGLTWWTDCEDWEWLGASPKEAEV